jgi:hypothetical protein
MSAHADPAIILKGTFISARMEGILGDTTC